MHNWRVNSEKQENLMISRVFLAHPQAVNETYLQHLRFATWFALKLLWAAIAAAIHAVVPSCHEKTASTIIAELYERTSNRGVSK